MGLDLVRMVRNVLTKWRWLRRLSMTMSSSVIIHMTRGATLLMLQTMSHSRRRSARRTSGKTASLNMRRLLLMKQYLFAERLWSRTVMSKVLRFAELSMSQSAGLNKKYMMLKMTWLNAKQRLRRNVKMKLQVTPQTQSAPSGPRKSALYPRSQSRSILQLLDALRSQGRFVLLLDVGLRRELRNVLIKYKL